MGSYIRRSEIASFLADVEDEFSPSRLEVYASEVRNMLPDAAREDLELAFQALEKAQESIRKAASRLGPLNLIDGLHI